MNLSEIFIRRPVATILLMVAIAFFGGVAYQSLPVSDLPNVDLPTLLVTASLPGASPDTMASAVATPLENQFSTIAGLQSMTSTNSLGTTQVVLEFDLEPQPRRSRGGRSGGDHASVAPAAARHADAAHVRESEPGRPADFVPGLGIEATASVHAGRVCRNPHRAADLDGVRRRAGGGSRRAEVRRSRRRWIPFKLASRQIGLNEVENALKNWNVNLPTGTINGPRRAFTLQASGQLMSAEQYKPVIVDLQEQFACPP